MLAQRLGLQIPPHLQPSPLWGEGGVRGASPASAFIAFKIARFSAEAGKKPLPHMAKKVKWANGGGGNRMNRRFYIMKPLKKSLRSPEGAVAIPWDCFAEFILSCSPLRLGSGRTVEGLAMTPIEDFFRGFYFTRSSIRAIRPKNIFTSL